jgi:hypothetical protein
VRHNVRTTLVSAGLQPGEELADEALEELGALGLLGERD